MLIYSWYVNNTGCVHTITLLNSIASLLISFVWPKTEIYSLAAYMTEDEVLQGIIYPSTSRYIFVFHDCWLSQEFEILYNLQGSCMMSLTSKHFCRIRNITEQVAAAVVKEAIKEDLAEGYREMDARELQKLNEVCLLSLINAILKMELVWLKLEVIPSIQLNTTKWIQIIFI